TDDFRSTPINRLPFGPTGLLAKPLACAGIPDFNHSDDSGPKCQTRNAKKEPAFFCHRTTSRPRLRTLYGGVSSTEFLHHPGWRQSFDAIAAPSTDAPKR